ncbi:hypothetical protein MK805_06445 [Shimazuella sp. AN120528]|uniref:hypothetical protein n=1 Tax=Shimazuella soli TaxID=1892854 RepID=UPI001F0FEE91|nr:hypothetical protein [Shimazuella soli]MCH5584607.1 hypothetical protein [Shimazuella soli]
MALITFLWNALFVSVVELIYLVGVLIVIGFILGVLEKQSQIYLTKTFGRRGILITAWIGTPIHEIGHWIQCVIWLHKVKSVKLLQTKDLNGVLGYVEHQYNPNSVYQRIGNFFIGIGPIISGVGTIILAMYLLVPQSFATLQNQIHQNSATNQTLDLQMFQSLGKAVVLMGESLFTTENFTQPTFWIFVILAICISSHIALSKPDIENSSQGLLSLLSVLILINLITPLYQVDTYSMIKQFTEYNAYLLAFSSIAVLFSLISLVISFLFYKIKR